MTISDRDRRALIVLAVAFVLALGYRFWPSPEAVPAVSAAPATIPLAEKRLAQLRQIVSTIPGKIQVSDAVADQLREREKALLEAETGAQAQAQLLQILRKLAASQAPPVELGQVDMGPIQPFGADYGEVLVSISFQCAIEQLVNLLADISGRPEMIATNDLQIQTGDAKQKTLRTRLTVSGLLPRRLLPERKGPGAF